MGRWLPADRLRFGSYRVSQSLTLGDIWRLNGHTGWLESALSIDGRGVLEWRLERRSSVPLIVAICLSIVERDRDEGEEEYTDSDEDV